MLNKSVCKKCCKKHWPALIEKYNENSERKPWIKRDDYNWEKNKYVVCPSDVDVNDFPTAATYKAPPCWCMYKLEHAVAAGMKK